MVTAWSMVHWFLPKQQLRAPAWGEGQRACSHEGRRLKARALAGGPPGTEPAWPGSSFLSSKFTLAGLADAASLDTQWNEALVR